MMRRRSQAVALVGAVGAMLLIAAAPARAYIDPQSGSYVIQILIAGLAAGGLAIATFWRRILAFIRRRFGRGSGEKASPTAASPEVVGPASSPLTPRVETSDQPGAPTAEPTRPSGPATSDPGSAPPGDEAPERSV